MRTDQNKDTKSITLYLIIFVNIPSLIFGWKISLLLSTRPAIICVGKWFFFEFNQSNGIICIVNRTNATLTKFFKFDRSR